jgi:hypothetical protein
MIVTPRRSASSWPLAIQLTGPAVSRSRLIDFTMPCVEPCASADIDNLQQWLCWSTSALALRYTTRSWFNRAQPRESLRYRRSCVVYGTGIHNPAAFVLNKPVSPGHSPESLRQKVTRVYDTGIHGVGTGASVKQNCMQPVSRAAPVLDSQAERLCGGKQFRDLRRQTPTTGRADCESSSSNLV